MVVDPALWIEDLSPSIAYYRHQARHFDGGPDGKIHLEFAGGQDSQGVICAGNN